MVEKHEEEKSAIKENNSEIKSVGNFDVDGDKANEDSDDIKMERGISSMSKTQDGKTST